MLRVPGHLHDLEVVGRCAVGGTCTSSAGRGAIGVSRSLSALPPVRLTATVRPLPLPGRFTEPRPRPVRHSKKRRFLRLRLVRAVEVASHTGADLDERAVGGKNGNMRFLGGAVQVGFVCLTALSTLIAGVPYFDCVCPNGNHKPFCLGVSSPQTGCCCGGSCCSSSAGKCCCCKAQDSSPDEQSEQSCCCKSQQQSSTDAPAKGIRVEGSCCQKTLASNEFLSISPTKEIAKQNSMDRFFVPLPQPVSVPPALAAGRRLFSSHRCDLPPPPDLVITLQHFLI
jgi:hypothetical protein